MVYSQRGKQGSTNPSKIRGEEKYEDKNTGKFQRKDMGTVKVSLDYSKGHLAVNLLSAHNVAGKKSQDAFASVFLIKENLIKPFQWNEGQRVYFKYLHKDTKVFEKNRDPVFKEMFVFQTDLVQ